MTFTAGAPSGYQITANSDTPLAGAADALSISLVDAFGNTVSSFTDNKTLTFSGLGKSPAGNAPTVSDQAGTPQTLGTPETIAFASGVGSASLLAYNAEGPVTLAASDGTLSTSSAGGAGVVLRVSSTGTQSAYRITGSATPTVGQAEGLTIAAVDSYGNTETSVSGDKNLTFSGLDAAPDGTAPTVTDKGGTAQTLGTAEAITFASGVSSAGGSLMAYKAEGPVTLAVQDDATPTALASSSVGGAGLSLTVSAGAVSALGSTVSANPASVTADGSSSSAITVTLLDAHNNPVSGITVTLGSSGGSSTVSAASGPSDSSGVVSFTVQDTVAETTTYTATDTSDSGLVITATATVSFTAGPVSAVASTVSASPGSVTADGATPSTITVTLKDAEGNPVSGKTVTLAKTSGAGTPVIAAIQGTSDASGVATFSVKSTTAALDVFAATDSTDGVTVPQTAGVTFTAGAPSGYQITANSDTPAAGVADALSISLVDAFGNTVSSFTDNKTLTFSGLGKSPAGNAPTVSDQAGTPQTLGTPETIAFASGVGSASLLAYNAEGPVTLAASDGTWSTSSAGGAGVVLRVSSTGTQSAYRITGSATPTVGQAEGLTIAAVDSYGNTETSVSGDKNLTFSGLDAAPDGTAPTVTDKGGTAQTLGTAEAITFASGVSSAGGSLMAYKAEGPVTLAVQDDATPTALASSSVGGAGLGFTVSAGAVSALGSTVSANPASVTADGSSSSAITDHAVGRAQQSGFGQDGGAGQQRRQFDGFGGQRAFGPRARVVSFYGPGHGGRDDDLHGHRHERQRPGDHGDGDGELHGRAG